MKKIYTQVFAFIVLALPICTVAQVSVLGHAGGPGDFVGWDATQNFPLQIRHDRASQPIVFHTGGSAVANRRMRINGSNVGAFNNPAIDASGHVGVGLFPDVIFSRLTLTGSNNAGTFGSGFRAWMKTGLYNIENSDAMYVGMKQEAGNNRSDAIISWSDDPISGFGGTDKLRFIFTSAADASTTLVNPLLSTSQNGYEYMRMCASPNQQNSANELVGNIGIGPLFTDALPPQNRLHINAEDGLATMLQITNQNGTGQTATDGLQIGIPQTAANNQPAVINQLENDRLSLFTNNGERVRVTHIGGLNAGTAFNPGGLANNLTRIGISHNPANPVTRPLSLLHLGYNTDATLPNENGWRPWMDVGMYVSEESDHTYLGLKNEGADRRDAVLSWGDNQANLGPLGAGPDNFRMIFTSTPFLGAGGTVPATGANGLEGLRLTPTQNTGVFTGVGGDPTANLYQGGSQNPTATLEVNAWGGGNNNSGLRFTNLTDAATPQVNTGPGVLSVNQNGDVIYVEANSAPAIGNYCPDPQQPLQDHFEVPLNGQSYSFTAAVGSNDESRVNIGNVTCGDLFPARLAVNLNEQMGSNTFHTSIAGFTDGGTLPAFTSQFGIAGILQGTTSYGFEHAGVIGASFFPNNDFFTNNTWGIGVIGTAEGGNNSINVGVLGTCENSADINIGVWGVANNATTNNWAGYFDGDIGHTGGIINTSDRRFKNNISPINSASSLIKRLKPSTYEMATNNRYGLVFPKGKQFGLIAQDVEQVLPELVKSFSKPTITDTTGKIISDSVTYKGVNYISLIPIIIAAMQEQQEQIETKDSLIDNLNDRLFKLENCVMRLNLCNNTTFKTAPTNTNEDNQSNSTNTVSQHIKLTDPQTIVLDQNVPNPFAEKTGIPYFLPKSVKNAKIIFHNQEGKFVNSIELTERGNSTLHVYADDLSSGIYTYTLIADDKVIDTKKMIKE